MNWLDIILVIILALFTILGLKNGLIKMGLFLAGVLIGLVLAGKYYAPLGEKLTYVFDAGIAKIIAFGLILLAVMVAAHLITRLLHWLTSLVMLGWVDHLGGAAFGLVIGAVLGGAGLAAWIKFLGMNSAIQDSGLAAVLLGYLPIALALLPKEFDSVRSFFRPAGPSF
ncbi:MAG: CvpA family protein [Chloroflexi bacterium]|nr:CvpA family protein [Chloroflexota bacterium]